MGGSALAEADGHEEGERRRAQEVRAAHSWAQGSMSKG